MGLFDRFKKKEEEPKAEEKIRPLETSAKTVKKQAEKIIPVKPVKKEEKTIKRVKKEDTKDAHRILLKPHNTEKATDLGKYGQYIFTVAKGANKIEIKKAIYDLYGVKAKSINVINQSGIKVTYGRSKGRTKDWKKAVITLMPGDKIEIYEGV